MSADEFDPDIERLFARAPNLSDAALFTARVEQRLQKGSALRGVALAGAGLVGVAVAAREFLTVSISPDAGVVSGEPVGQGLRSVSISTQSAVESGLEQLGMQNLELGSMSGMQLFWIVAGALIAVAAAGVMRLSQEI